MYSIKENIFYPLFLIAPLFVKGHAIFRVLEKEINLDVPEKLLRSVIEKCQGHKTLKTVVDELSIDWERVNLKNLFNDLIELNIIVNSRDISNLVWNFVKNPTIFYNDLSDDKILGLVQKAHYRNRQGPTGTKVKVNNFGLKNIIENRKSVRYFSTQNIEKTKLAQLLWASYGLVGDHLVFSKEYIQQRKVWQGHKLDRRTVPSAGALYTFRIFVTLFRKSGSLKPGVYEIKYRSSSYVEFVKLHDDIIAVRSSFADPYIVNNAHGCLILAGSFDICSEKYTNRSLLYIPIEAGHINQNFHLTASELGVSTVEIGGFLEDKLSESLLLDKEFVPLITTLFGYKEEKDKQEEVNIPLSIEIEWSRPSSKYSLPFYMVFARQKGGEDNDWACGRSYDPNLALKKALSESEEWHRCSQIPPYLNKAKIDEIEDNIDPMSIVAYHSSQYNNPVFPLKPLSSKIKYLWKEGLDEFSGKKKMILADHIYFPYYPYYPRYTFANSSGNATHSNKTSALQAAVLEIIERDAFSICFLNRLNMPTIRLDSMPENIKRRIICLKKIGFHVVVKDISMDLAPVILVCAQNQVLPMTTCAACSDFNLQEALNHALMEVESAIFCRLTSIAPTPIKPANIHFPEDHGNIYSQKKYFKKSNFLSEPSKKIDLKNILTKPLAKNWNALLDKLARDFSLLTVDLSGSSIGSSKNQLFTIKAFIPGTVPMHFGYGLQPFGMRRLYELPYKIGISNRRSEYSSLVKFPHPYT